MADILLVEDSVAEQKIALEALHSVIKGCRVHVAADGESALNYLNEKSRWELPDIVLLDLNLPRLDGREVLRRIKTNPRYHQVPVIILTNSSDIGDIQDCYALHANCFLTKPLEYEDFCHMAEQVNLFWLRRLQGVRDESYSERAQPRATVGRLPH